MLTQYKELGRLSKHEPSLTIHYNLANAPLSPIIKALLTLSFLFFCWVHSTLLSWITRISFLSRGPFLLKLLKGKIFLSSMNPLKWFSSCRWISRNVGLQNSFRNSFLSAPPLFQCSSVQGNSAQQHLTLYCPPCPAPALFDRKSKSEAWLTEVPTLPLPKFLNPIRKPPNKTIPLLQTSLSPSSWGPEKPVLKAYWATVVACGHRFSKHPKSGSPRESLGVGNSSAMGTQACVDPNPCGENITAPWLVGTGVSKGALAWPQALLLPCSHEGRSSGCMKNASTHLGKGGWGGCGLAHKAQAMQERCVSCFFQAIHLSWAISKVSQTCTCLSDMNHMMVFSKQSLASLHLPAKHHCCRQGQLWTGQNITNGDLQILSVGVSKMKQSRSKKINSFYPVAVGIQTFKKIL